MNLQPTNGTNPEVKPDWVPPSVSQLAELFPGFEVLELLGHGGMGAVYKARQQSLDRLVAIKILPPPAEEDPLHASARFVHEARTMARLSHPGIVGIHDFGESSDRQLFYFVMEFIDGTDLAQAIRGSQFLSPADSIRVIGDVCEALAYAHSHGIIHRDIKPANILLDTEGRVKVADFGLARIVDPAQTQNTALTRSNISMGTPDYAAPEVLTPHTNADERADLYSVGVMLYQMLTGEVPRGLFKMPSQKRETVDTRFDAIICKAMEADLQDRYQSAEEITRALEEINFHPATPETVEPTTRKGRRLIAVTLGIAMLAAGGFYAFDSSGAGRDLTTKNPNITPPPAFIDINKLTVNGGNIASLASVGSYDDEFELEFVPSCATDGIVCGSIEDHLPGSDRIPVHTIFHDFGSIDDGPFSSAKNELLLEFDPPVHLVELAAYVTSADSTGSGEFDRMVTQVGFWINVGNGLEHAANVVPLDSNDLGGFDRVSIRGDWAGVTQVVYAFSPVGTQKFSHHEVRVAEVVAKQSPR